MGLSHIKTYATQATHFSLVYGAEVVDPIESVSLINTCKQNNRGLRNRISDIEVLNKRRDNTRAP